MVNKCKDCGWREEEGCLIRRREELVTAVFECFKTGELTELEDSCPHFSQYSGSRNWMKG